MTRSCLLWPLAGCLLILPGCQSESDDNFRTFREVQADTEQADKAETLATNGQPSTDDGNRSPQTGDTPVASPAGNSGGDNANSPAGNDPAQISADLRNSAHFRMPAIAEKPVVEPREITLLIPENSFRVEGPEDALRVSYDDLDLLKVLNMEPVPMDCAKHFPGWLKELDGKRIRIRGFMYPPFQEKDIPFFVLARDNDICCMGRDPKRYDVIDVSMRDDVTTYYIANRPFDVVGVLRIRPEGARGQLYQLYVIEDAIVIEL